MRFDWAGFVLLVSALVALLNVPVVGHRAGWASVAAFAVLALPSCSSPPSSLGVSRACAAARAPAVPLPAFRTAALVAFAYGVGLFGTTYLVPVFVQDIAHYIAVARRLPAGRSGAGARRDDRARRAG